MKDLHEYACIDVVASDGYKRAEMALDNALHCDAYPEELLAASRAATVLANEAAFLSRRLRKLGSA